LFVFIGIETTERQVKAAAEEDNSADGKRKRKGKRVFKRGEKGVSLALQYY
jgi:hypothetical protein